MATFVLVLLAVMSAGVLLRAERLGYLPAVYVSKPLTTITIIVLALLPEPAVDGSYRLLVAAGLVASLGGDVFLMLPRDRFLPGLVSFFVAHVFYIAAFAGRATPDGIAPFLPFLIAALFVSRLLWRHAGALRWPVAAYALILAAMGGSALATAGAVLSTGAVLAAVGAVLFLLSDTALGMNRFVGTIKGGHTLVLATYFPAQILIALSVSIA